MKLTEILAAECVKVPLNATDKTEAITELVDLLSERGKLTDRDEVLRAVLDVFRYTRFDFVTRQVLGQRLVPRLGHATAPNVGLDRLARLFHRLGQTLGGIGRVVAVLEVETQLIGVVEAITLAP